MIRKNFHFYGRVQGVGFRYTAKYCARSLGLTGWAKNEVDGSVTMQAQGTETAINRMLERLNSDSFIRIDHIDTQEIPVLPDEEGFSCF